MARNECCTKCVSFLIRDKFDTPACYGVEVYSAETEGCMHCYKPTIGNKVKDEITLVESSIQWCEEKIKDAKCRKEKLEARLRELKGGGQ